MSSPPHPFTPLPDSVHLSGAEESGRDAGGWENLDLTPEFWAPQSLLTKPPWWQMNRHSLTHTTHNTTTVEIFIIVQFFWYFSHWLVTSRFNGSFFFFFFFWQVGLLIQGSKLKGRWSYTRNLRQKHLFRNVKKRVVHFITHIRHYNQLRRRDFTRQLFVTKHNNYTGCIQYTCKTSCQNDSTACFGVKSLNGALPGGVSQINSEGS